MRWFQKRDLNLLSRARDKTCFWTSDTTMEVEFEVTVDGSKFQASDKQFRSHVQVGKGLNSTVFKVAATAVQQQEKKDDDDDKTASSIYLALKLETLRGRGGRPEDQG